jgi:hypothetical protein
MVSCISRYRNPSFHGTKYTGFAALVHCGDIRRDSMRIPGRDVHLIQIRMLMQYKTGQGLK